MLMVLLLSMGLRLLANLEMGMITVKEFRDQDRNHISIKPYRVGVVAGNAIREPVYHPAATAAAVGATTLGRQRQLRSRFHLTLVSTQSSKLSIETMAT